MQNMADGSLRVKHREFWYAPSIMVGQTSTVESRIFFPGNSGISRLDSFANLFELYRINSARIYYKTATGTTQSGMLHVGVDYDSKEIPTTVAGVAVLYPSFTIPIWSESSLSVQPDRANRAKWMFTFAGGQSHQDMGVGFAVLSGLAASPGAIELVPGEIWIDYDITYSGPVSNQATFSTMRSQQGVLVTADQPIGIMDWNLDPSGYATDTGTVGAQNSLYIGYDAKKGKSDVWSLVYAPSVPPSRGSMLIKYEDLTPARQYQMTVSYSFEWADWEEPTPFTLSNVSALSGAITSASTSYTYTVGTTTYGRITFAFTPESSTFNVTDVVIAFSVNGILTVPTLAASVYVCGALSSVGAVAYSAVHRYTDP